MKYTDKIYGKINITEKVIIEIIESSDFQRLIGIDQAGYFDVYFPGTKHSRFEHSVGCYILLKKFGASIEEQIAGLIHDISHSAFSHTADYVFDSGRGADHNYQDDIFEDFVRQTKIPEILKKYNYDVDYILNENNFPLQENELPDLCADRIDYSLRGAFHYIKMNTDKIDYFLDNLKVNNNEWVFNSYEAAFKYAKLFKKLNDIYYSNKETAAMFKRTSDWIKYAAKRNYITHTDLFVTDKEVINQINKHLANDKKLAELWEYMNNSEINICKKGESNCEQIIVKSRIVDPSFLDGDIIKRISEINREWGSTVNMDKEPKIYYLKKSK
ncbi:MAG: HD domain-containing protein [Candidatus Moraniibacteriota bacterium]|jgi:uncharacterized protein